MADTWVPNMMEVNNPNSRPCKLGELNIYFFGVHIKDTRFRFSSVTVMFGFKSDLEQEEENEDHCGGGRVGGTRLPVPMDAVYKVVDAQKQTEKGSLYELRWPLCECLYL